MDNDFYIRKITPEDVANVIYDTGFDKCYIDKAVKKYKFSLIKIHNLTSPQASIIKQLALSVGGDAAVHREVITCKIDKSDLLLGCTETQLRILAEKLSHQPFSLSKISKLLLKQMDISLPSLNIRKNTFDWTKKTYIMGILNITPDSFSDGGNFISLDKAINHAKEMIEAGADIIDIGGETTKPFSQGTPDDIQLERIIPVLKKIREFSQIPISIDTRSSIVAIECINNGADVINDVSGFDYDREMLKTIAETQVPIIIMHSLTTPDKMQIEPDYEKNIIDEVFKSLYDKTKMAIEAGIKRENIIIDPGIGFGKTLEHNLEIIRRISEFKSLELPILVGVSRKSVISNILNLPTQEREEANIAIASYLASNGANILRVHDVQKHTRALKVLDKIVK